MSRRHSAEKREVLPDPKFGNIIITKFMNSVMYAGKKSVAEGIVYGALGMIETRGLVPAIEAADAMTKASEVRLIGRQFVGGGYVTVLVRGETGAVNAAVRAGADACERVGDGLAAAHIIARPHSEVEQVLPSGPNSLSGGRDSDVAPS